MPIRKPDPQEYFNYIILTHQAEKIDVSMAQIKKTLAKASGKEDEQFYGKKNEERIMASPYAEGHFKAINYAEKLAASTDFPAKDISVLTNEFASHTALYWLREMHTLMMYPIAKFGQDNNTGLLYLQPSEVGTYRYKELQLAFRPAPHPELIPKLLHFWLRDITELDLEIRDKVDNPYGLTPEQGGRIFRKVKEASLFLSCLCPFSDGNNRIAKLVENTLRLRWRMPWRIIGGVESDSFIRDLAAYSESGMNKWLAMTK